MGDTTDTIGYYSSISYDDLPGSKDSGTMWSIRYGNDAETKIEQVANGYIVEADGEKYVFSTFKSLMKWMAKRYDEKI